MQASLRERQAQPAPGPDAPPSTEQPGKTHWYTKFTALFGSKAPAASAAAPDVNPLLAFPSETGSRTEPVQLAEARKKAAPKQPERAKPAHVQRYVLIVLAIVIIPSIGVLALRRFPQLLASAPAPRTGNLTIDTRPAGSQVLIDGVDRGTTPLTLALDPGAHTVTLRNAADERVVPIAIAAGGNVSQYFDMKPVEAAAVFGRISVVTDPPGARITVDGKLRGNAPLTIADLNAEEHKVTVANDAGAAERMVAVAAGSTTSVMFSLPKSAGPVGGWLTVSAPFDVEVLENDDVIGASGSTRIMLAAGRHDLVLANRKLGFQETRKVDVPAGKTAAIRIDPPKVSMSVNARPWAEVVVDGANMGQTPLANLQVTVGSHELIFRHPQLGERKQTVVVTAAGPNRIAADFTK
jgi:PEGA domain-containing protein